MANTFEYRISDLSLDAIEDRGTQMEALLAADLRLAKAKAAGAAPREQEVRAIQRVADLEMKLHNLGHCVEKCRWCTLNNILAEEPPHAQ